MPYVRTLNWGILGTGGIARKLAAAINASRTGNLVAAASRDLKRAQAFCQEFDTRLAFGSYEEMMGCSEVDVVYVALPNHLHAEWTMRCAASGKHILCEKPLTVNHVEAERAIAAAKSARVFLMEAFMYRCHPQVTQIADILRRGEIGEVRLVQGSFAYDLGTKSQDVRLVNAFGGGGILDVGCYPLSMARLVAGAAQGNPFLNPIEVRGTAHIGESSRVDEAACASLKFPGGMLATLTCGMRGNTENVVRIWGTEGHVFVPSPWFPPEKHARLVIRRRGESTPTELLVDAPGSLYVNEVDCVAQSILGGDFEPRPPAMSWADTLGNMTALDAWRAEVGLTFDCERY